MPSVLSLNVGRPRPIEAKSGWTGIDKQPVSGPVAVCAPGPYGRGESGLSGDNIADKSSHGGDDQAVYAYAREDLDWWQESLSEALRSGQFGENLTTSGLDVTGSLIGEQWRIGDTVLLQVTAPRIPCITFATWMRRRDWLKTFTRRAVPGAYLRVLRPGAISSGDPISVAFRPEHQVSIGALFRALTLEPDRLPSVLEAEEFLPPDVVDRARNREPFDL